MSDRVFKGRDVPLSTNARSVLEARYLLRDDQLRIVETPEQLFWRVACAVAEGDRPYVGNIEGLTEQFYDLMAGFDFLSVGVTEAYMRAMARGEKYDLVDPRTKRPVARADAREIFGLIVENA